MILSQMAYYDVKGVFLGTNSWNGPGLISIGGKGAEGSIFVDTFFQKNSSPLVARFVEEFRKTYQQPETLEALSYDGAKFIKEILQSKSVSSPSQLQEELRQVKNFQGVSGLKGFGEDGKAIRTLYILRVNKGQMKKFRRDNYTIPLPLTGEGLGWGCNYFPPQSPPAKGRKKFEIVFNHSFHSWNVSVELAIQIQEALKDQIIMKEKHFQKWKPSEGETLPIPEMEIFFSVRLPFSHSQIWKYSIWPRLMARFLFPISLPF